MLVLGIGDGEKPLHIKKDEPLTPGQVSHLFLSHKECIIWRRNLNNYANELVKQGFNSQAF